MDDANATVEKQHWFGLQSPVSVTGAAWGARAIYSLADLKTPYHRRGSFRTHYRTRVEARIELLWDRQQIKGGTDEEKKALLRWVDKRGLNLLKKECVKHYITNDLDVDVEVTQGGFYLRANPRSSFGYLYLVAWKGATTTSTCADCDKELAPGEGIIFMGTSVRCAACHEKR